MSHELEFTLRDVPAILLLCCLLLVVSWAVEAALKVAPMIRSTVRRVFLGVVAGFLFAASAFAQTYSANIQLTIDATAGGVSFTLSDILASGGHPQINSASCTNNSSGGAFRYRIDGGAPTSAVGVEVPEGGALLFGTTQALVNFKAIRTGGSSAVLSCTFSAETPMPPVYPVGAGGGGGGGVGSDVNIAEIGGGAVTTTVPGALDVNIVGGAGSGGTALADDADFTAGTTQFTPVGGFYQSAVTNCTDGDTCTFGLTIARGLKTSLYNATGTTAFGTAGSAAIPVLTVQGIAAMTPLLATVSDGAGALNVIVDSGTITAVTAISNALPAGNNNIGDVDVASIVPGTGATNLGKAEDAIHGSTDVGVMSLFVRQDAQSDLCADGDYCPATINADGELRVTVGGGTGGTAIADDADFSAGTTNFTPVGGFYQSAVTACTDGDACTAGITVGRAVKVAIAAADGSLTSIATDGTFDSEAPATGPAIGLRAASTNPTDVADGDLVSPMADLDGQQFTIQSATAYAISAGTDCNHITTASTNATNCKGSAGNLYSYEFVNTTATLAYVRLYNLSSSPTCNSATGFIRSIPVPASTTGAGIVRDLPVPVNYGTGIGFCVTGGGSSTDNTNAPAGVYVNLVYK